MKINQNHVLFFLFFCLMVNAAHAIPTSIDTLTRPLTQGFAYGDWLVRVGGAVAAGIGGKMVYAGAAKVAGVVVVIGGVLVAAKGFDIVNINAASLMLF